jgi:hypothetical protein
MPVARLRTAFSHLDRLGNPCLPRRFAEGFDILAKGWSQNAAASRISALALGGKEPDLFLGFFRTAKKIIPVIANPDCYQ